MVGGSKENVRPTLWLRHIHHVLNGVDTSGSVRAMGIAVVLVHVCNHSLHHNNCEEVALIGDMERYDIHHPTTEGEQKAKSAK